MKVFGSLTLGTTEKGDGYFHTSLQNMLYLFTLGEKKNAEINRKAGNVNIFLNGHKLRIDTLIMEIEWWFLSLRGTKD